MKCKFRSSVSFNHERDAILYVGFVAGMGYIPKLTRDSINAVVIIDVYEEVYLKPKAVKVEPSID